MEFAIVKCGGRQYKVQAGSKLKVEKIDAKIGDKINLETLLLADEKGDKVELGKPKLTSKVEAKIISQGRRDKIHVIKFKSKVRYHRNVGHRQPYTEIEIVKI